MKTYIAIALFGAVAAVRLSKPDDGECKYEKAARKGLEALGDADLGEVAEAIAGEDGKVSLDEAKAALEEAGIEGITEDDLKKAAKMVDEELGNGDGDVDAEELEAALGELKKWGAEQSAAQLDGVTEDDVVEAAEDAGISMDDVKAVVDAFKAKEVTLEDAKATLEDLGLCPKAVWKALGGRKGAEKAFEKVEEAVLAQEGDEDLKQELKEAVGDVDVDAVLAKIKEVVAAVKSGELSLDEVKAEGKRRLEELGLCPKAVWKALGGLKKEIKKWLEEEEVLAQEGADDLSEEDVAKLKEGGKALKEKLAGVSREKLQEGLEEVAGDDGEISLDEAKDALREAGLIGEEECPDVDRLLKLVGGEVDKRAGNGDGKVQVGEAVDALVWLQETELAQQGEDDVVGRLKKAGRKIQKALEGVCEEELEAGLEAVAGDDGEISLEEARGALKKAGIELKDSDLELVGGLVDEHLGDGDGKVQVDEAVKALKKLRELDLDEEEGECRLKAAGKKVQEALAGVSREEIEAGLEAVAGDDGEISLEEAQGALKAADIQLSDEEVAIVGGLIDQEAGNGDGKVQVGEAVDALVWLQDADLDALQ